MASGSGIGSTWDFIPRAYASAMSFGALLLACVSGGGLGGFSFLQGVILFCGWPWLTIVDEGHPVGKVLAFAALFFVWVFLTLMVGSLTR